MFLGSAVEADGKHVLLYTGVSQKDGKKSRISVLPLEMGETYEKWQDNPVIKGDIMPEKLTEKTSVIRKYGKRMADIIVL